MTTNSCTRPPAKWATGFLAMLPEIESRLRYSFRDLSPELRDDSTEDGIVHCLLSYVRLFEQERVDRVTPASLTRFATLHLRSGRHAGCRLNSKDPLSRYSQYRTGIKVVQLSVSEPGDDVWINDMVDSRQAPVAEQVAIKLDFVAWLGSLCRRTRNIAADLAQGFSTSEVSQKYGVTSSRIAQMRRELKVSWQKFQGEPAAAC
jgi:hypothetical protein